MKEIKLKSQPIWVVRSFILAGVVLGGVFAFVSHPIGGTNAQSVNTTVTPLTGEIVSYTLNEDSNTVFTAGILEISGDDKKIFILDRNLGATTTGDLTSALPTSYGYYFQWGNNYGFSPMSNIITGSQKIDCSGYGPNNPLYNNVLIYGYYGSSDYCLSGNDNLWGNTTNTNEARRGPCPENFHIPTSEEVNIIRYNSFNGLPVLIPLAGYMSSYNGSVRLAGMHYYLWSSSPGDYSVHNLGSEPADIYRTSALPIRCVYNFYDTYTAPASSPCPAGQYLATGDVCVTNDLDIVLQATATAANQTLKINKYFANAYTVDRGDGTTGNITADTTHSYGTAGTYNIILSLSGVDRWTFVGTNKPLVPKYGTTVTGVQIIYMPSLEEGFGNSATTPGDRFFRSFNERGAITSLPEGSFDTSNITTVGDYFFVGFNYNGLMTSLPEGSFRLSTGLTVVGNKFFSDFNSQGALTELPGGSFDITNITTVGDNFFLNFNYEGKITSLPEGSFDISNITMVGGWAFYGFNNGGALTNLPEGSFRFSTGLAVVGERFFMSFNWNGLLTSLPAGSFDTSNIKTVGDTFFSFFNYKGRLTSLPEGSFDTSNITTAGEGFFMYYNYEGELTSLPEGSFKTENIANVGDDFFSYFNYRGQIVDLPDSFKLSSLAYNKNNSYTNAFNSPNYTLNKKVSDLVSGVTAPNSDRNTFSDNQQGRCGVGPNWLVTTNDACSITYDSNGGNIITDPTKKYTSDSTRVVAGNGIDIPTKDGYVFDGWYTDPDGGNLVGNIRFPSMDGDILYAHWIEVETYVVTFDANGGITNQSSQTVAENATINLPNASRDGYEFLGWYTEETGGIRAGGYNDPYIVSQNITLYAHWIEALPEGIFFQTGDITYTDTNGKVFTGIGTITIRSGGKTITILDRNLGATTNDISDIGSHGYYFQWGNNYGFSLDDVFTINNTAFQATDYSWNNPYVSGNFIAAKYWDTSYNSGLWGGAEDYDNNRGIDTSDGGYARQGPCPAGYHVPSIGEFDELMRITKSITGGTVQLQTNYNGNLVESNPFAAAFMSELHFPIAGYIGWDGVYTGILEEGYSYSHFWSSSFKKANGYLMINHHPTASKKDKVSTRGNNMQQGNAFSIRCFKDIVDDGKEIVLSYETRDGSAIQAQALPVGGTGYLPGYSTHREDAELLGWYEEDLLTPVDLENKILDEDTTIYARWSDDYMVKFLDFDDTILKTEVVRSGDSAIAPVNPVRNGYTFNGWDLDFSNVTGDMVITAQYTKNQSTSNGGGGGGGGSSLKRDNCPDGDYSDSYYDGICGKKPIQKDDEKDSSTKPQNGKTGHNSAKNEVVYDTLKFNPHYSDEMNQAYQFAYHYGITTKTNIKDAAMNWELTRIAMAKMLSQYAINVLGIQPDQSRNNQFADVSDKLDTEYGDGVTLAYQLGIMGINMPNNEFRPYGYVTRAEFATALSRLLYNTSDGEYEKTSKYYVPHINKLAYEGILTNKDPYMKELRGYVMLMLMRSAK